MVPEDALTSTDSPSPQKYLVRRVSDAEVPVLVGTSMGGVQYDSSVPQSTDWVRSWSCITMVGQSLAGCYKTLIFSLNGTVVLRFIEVVAYFNTIHITMYRSLAPTRTPPSALPTTQPDHGCNSERRRGFVALQVPWATESARRCWCRGHGVSAHEGALMCLHLQ
jgi:hypothetical protein